MCDRLLLLQLCRMVITMGTGSLAITLELFPFHFSGSLGCQAGTSHTKRAAAWHSTACAATSWTLPRLFLAQLPCVQLSVSCWYAFHPPAGTPFTLPATPAVLCAGQHGIALAIWALNVALFITFLCLLLCRAVCYPASAKELLEQPNQSLFLGTLPMSISVVTGGVVALLVPRWVPHVAVATGWRRQQGSDRATAAAAAAGWQQGCACVPSDWSPYSPSVVLCQCLRGVHACGTWPTSAGAMSRP